MGTLQKCQRLVVKFCFLNLAAACTLLAGCVDFGHTAGYKLALRAPSVTFTTAQKQEELERMVRQTLLASGFKEATGRRTIWLKDGATVIIDRAGDDTLLLKLTSMGSANRVRTAKQIEIDLVQALRAHSQIALTPTARSNPMVN